MKPVSIDNDKKDGYQSDDDNIRYKFNTKFAKPIVVLNDIDSDEDCIRYKLAKPKQEACKSKPKIKVNFWSNKQTGSRLHNNPKEPLKSIRRHSIGETEDTSNSKPIRNVRKRVSFISPPLFPDNHVPMVTVPDDLTIQLNEKNVIDVRGDFNKSLVSSTTSTNGKKDKKLSRNSIPQTRHNRKRSIEELVPKNISNESELEFFSKYIVQKLRKMETNQRIYSENLINTVLMLGQLHKLNENSKITEA